MFDLVKSIFSRNRSETKASEQGELESHSLVVQNYPASIGIPLHRRKLLYVSRGSARNHAFGMEFTISIEGTGKVDLKSSVPDDPSTIYSTLPVREPEQKTPIPALPYFPSYSGMLPEQRAVYLKWLGDISQEIETGYVFVYYYGLERQLVEGDFDAAVDEILLLRKFHKNSSFQTYSASALVHSCLIRRRIDMLQRLYSQPDFDYYDNSNLLILHHSGLDILPDMMFRLANCLQGVNRRYLKLKPDLYQSVLVDMLNREFGKPSYPFADRFLLADVRGIPYPIFANISLPNEVRTPSLPNLLHHKPFQLELNAFFKKVHDSIKQQSTRKKRDSIN